PVIWLDLAQSLRQPAAGILRVWHSDLDIRPPKKEAFLADPTGSQNEDLLRLGRTAHANGSGDPMTELLCLTETSRLVTEPCCRVGTVSTDTGQQIPFTGVHRRSPTPLIFGKPRVH